MRKILCILIISVCTISFNCRKKLDQYGLPPATQEGKNIFGFLVNGKPWTPKGGAGLTGNLTIGFGNGTDLRGVFSIHAKRILSDIDREYAGLGMRDSLFTQKLPFTIPLTNNGLFRISYSTNNCEYFSHDPGTQVSGHLTITKSDGTKGIFAGTFSATFSKPGCARVNLTEGRFDMKTR